MTKFVNHSLLRAACKAALVIFCTLLLQTAWAEEELIPYKSFTLDNGLTLIVHEDDKAPIVAVNIWYHVGSRNEKPGQTGYAHLFEHLMFQGSENSNGEYLELLETVGATTLNGTTWFDRTNYYQTVPVDALDRVLFLESDRMGHMLGAIDQAVLDEQRGVVQNEKRQGDNQPYAAIWEALLKQVFPTDHPYSWETIGSMEDLQAASLEDMQEWFRTYYGPNNAVLVVAGAVKAEDVLKKVEHWFGDIEPGPPLIVQKEWIPTHTSERRQLIQDRVPQARIYLAWPGPRWGTTDANQLTLAADILANGKNSRLYERLVYQDQIATDVSLATFSLEISGIMILEVSVKPGVDVDLVERVTRAELENFFNNGPSKKELQRVKMKERSAFIRGIERIGGSGSKSSVLAENAVYGGNPGGYQQQLDDLSSATPKQVRDVAQRWFDQPPYVAHIVPYPELSFSDTGADRSTLPTPGTPATARFPQFTSTKLDNGLNIIVVNRPSIPVVNMNLIFDAGSAGDRPNLTGEASITMSMLDEGAGNKDALEISEQLALLGAELSAGAGLDTASVSLSALTENLEPSLDLFADVVLRPTFPEAELERVRSQYLTAIQQEKSRPLSMALRLLPEFLYGEGHPYAQPLTGSGTEVSVAAITRADLINWHNTWFKPNNATLVVVGDTTLEEITPHIEKLFHNWEAGKVPEKNTATVERVQTDGLYLIDKPGAEQSIIFAGQLVVPMNNPNEIAIEAMNDVLGGQFSARINMNLREEKSWSYGARSLITATRAQRPFLMYAPVQTDKTAPALAEMLREITEIRGKTPPTTAELERVQKSNILSLPGRWETNPAVLSDLAQLVTYGLPDDYWDTYPQRLNELQLEQVVTAANDTIDQAELVWIVVGDRARIEEELNELQLGEIRIIDADGNAVTSH
ncbi:MAG: insulinase family protein [Gammaproteobacteria bacterium]|nr:insulinase family protein [Gammaproteobacteria bacterium]MCP4089055.1 insulinase family protein [Gammaproteobacteria bacterium]MCP4278045.1 insulinase family protein [Gammaproteobacteria bacterium]MCP4833021.1 insulinase family protein [Gammaproteobacteria bacterium]MCP4929262.1 insulinase family protein [Gammaproteobacteria bacterium]